MGITQLMAKYNIPIPRYTSYPTVPYWDKDTPDHQRWFEVVKETFDQTNKTKGIAIYIHLPYCEKLCTYCACTKHITKNHDLEAPYVDALLKEWQTYLDTFEDRPVIRELHLGGGTPTFFSTDSLQRLLSFIINSGEKHAEYEFSFEAHPNNTSKAHLQTLFDLGFRRLSLGVQDFDPEVQKVINRIQTYETVDEVVNNAREIGYESVNFDLIYGLPKQKASSVEDTLKKVRVLNPDRIAFYSYAHVPWKEKGQRGFTDEDIPTGEEKRELYEIGKRLLLEIGFEDIGMDHFSKPTDKLNIARNQGTLHRNFMGYTTSEADMIIGLGASSISDAGRAYMQNEKNIEFYKNKINSNEPAFIKGHFLNHEDRTIKRAILDIACQGKLTFNDDLVNYMTFQMLTQLKAMEEEGVIVRNPRGFALTPELGKMFLRNVCSVFDIRMQDKAEQDVKFSKSI
ncbi:oxygen-independent coproporphyrinogen III oxidase [Halosquirtibacter xylanolyticus]|uniref:oxygen-independent coproporphyrinogen III oxidase n=1 Tax=Halosquirtibacter xylanolyticus TaxID=3374599 RepID=UPI0037487DE5|nr:oxygen-independent coproporphyrinogen III oxidase [Prolixibacteraceae bacterium]